jgi:hypothetical protein
VRVGVCAAVAFSLLALSTAAAYGQLQPGDRYERGASILHPERVTGVWDMLQPDGRAIGISISITTTVPGDATTLRNVPQEIEDITILTYTRYQGTNVRHWWPTRAPDGHLEWINNHLRFQALNARDGSQLDLDLMFDPAQNRWSGTFPDADYSGQAVLTRPAGTSPSAPIGTWQWMSVNQPECIHIGLAEDGRVLTWSDRLSVRADPPLPHEQPLPDRNVEVYGETGYIFYRYYGSLWELPIGSVLGGETVFGGLRKDRAIFGGSERHYGSGAVLVGDPSVSFMWYRMSGDSCIDGATVAADSVDTTPARVKTALEQLHGFEQTQSPDDLQKSISTLGSAIYLSKTVPADYVPARRTLVQAWARILRAIEVNGDLAFDSIDLRDLENPNQIHDPSLRAEYVAAILAQRRPFFQSRLDSYKNWALNSLRLHLGFFRDVTPPDTVALEDIVRQTGLSDASRANVDAIIAGNDDATVARVTVAMQDLERFATTHSRDDLERSILHLGAAISEPELKPKDYVERRRAIVEAWSRILHAIETSPEVPRLPDLDYVAMRSLQEQLELFRPIAERDNAMLDAILQKSGITKARRRTIDAWL